MVLKLTYFAFPGRGETTRVILTVGKVPFEDDTHYEYNEWPAHKSVAPFGHLPILQLEDGRILAESGAIEQYAAKLAGLYPKDPATAAFAVQWALLSKEMLDSVIAAGSITDKEALHKARRDLFTGKLGDKLASLQKAVEKGPYLAGDELSFADITAYVIISNLRSGAFEGTPTDFLVGYPTLAAWVNKIASLEPIKAYYANATGVREAFKPT